jgi:outer membrane lipoprotein-sorting protein
MKNFNMKAAFLMVVLIILAGLPAAAQKMTADEIIGKHLDSMGAKEARDAVKNQLLLADVQFTLKGTATIIRGKGLILSERAKVLFGMNFNSNEYPQDRFVFDGKSVTVSRPLPSSSRSLIGEYLYHSDVALKDGLFGGTLSASWSLFDPAARKAKVSYDGTKEINGNQVYVLKYSPRSSSDSIKIYIDVKTYQHVRTEYTRALAASQGGDALNPVSKESVGRAVDNSAGMGGTIYRVTEDFSDFKKMGGLMLPGTYKITYSRSGTTNAATSNSTNRDAEWTFAITDVGLNRELEPDSFKIEK